MTSGSVANCLSTTVPYCPAPRTCSFSIEVPPSGEVVSQEMPCVVQGACRVLWLHMCVSRKLFMAPSLALSCRLNSWLGHGSRRRRANDVMRPEPYQIGLLLSKQRRNVEFLKTPPIKQIAVTMLLMFTFRLHVGRCQPLYIRGSLLDENVIT